MRRPPYYKRLKARSDDRLARIKAGLAAGGPQVLWILAGSNAWDVARDMEPWGQLFLVCPDDATPGNLNWSMRDIDNSLTWGDEAFVKILGSYSDEQVRQLITAMMLQGFKRIFVFDMRGDSFECQRFYMEGEAVG